MQINVQICIYVFLHTKLYKKMNLHVQIDNVPSSQWHGIDESSKIVLVSILSTYLR